MPCHRLVILSFNHCHFVDGVVCFHQVRGCACGQCRNAAQLAPYANGWPAYLLKLPDAPRGGPCFNARRSFKRWFAVEVVAHGVAVDVLCHVLCYIARSAAFGPVDGAKVAAVRVCAGFVGAVAHGVLCDGASDCLGIIGRVEHQQMPMWRAIVLWFGDSEPINWSCLVLELGADTRPYLR